MPRSRIRSGYPLIQYLPCAGSRRLAAGSTRPGRFEACLFLFMRLEKHDRRSQTTHTGARLRSQIDTPGIIWMALPGLGLVCIATQPAECLPARPAAIAGRLFGSFFFGIFFTAADLHGDDRYRLIFQPAFQRYISPLRF